MTRIAPPLLAVLLLCLPLLVGAPGLLALAGLVPVVGYARRLPPVAALMVGWGVATLVWAIATDWVMTAMATMGGASPVLAATVHLAHALWCGLPFGLLMACLSRPLWLATGWRRCGLSVLGGGWLSLFPQPLPVPVTLGLAMDERLLQWAALGAWVLPAFGLWFALTWTEPSGKRHRWLALLGLLVIMAGGQWRLMSTPPTLAAAVEDAGAGFRVAVLQPSLSPERADASSREAVESLVRASRALLAGQSSRVDLLVWPEVPVALSFSDRESDRLALRGLVADTGVPLLVNGYAHLDDGGLKYSNSSWLLMPDGRHQRYDKQVLVPFGEYLPEVFTAFAGLLPGVKRYQPGALSHPLALEGRLVGTPICFEALMPARLRAMKDAGVVLFVNQGNDIWFRSARAHRLHLSIARLRTVEVGVPMLRVFNSGISVLIDERGRLSDQYGEVDGLFEGVFVLSLPLPQAGVRPL